MRVTKRLMAALLACLMLLSLLPVPAYAADDGRIAHAGRGPGRLCHRAGVYELS